jgi:hypothetical protein
MQVIGKATLNQEHPTMIFIAPAAAGATDSGDAAPSLLTFAETTGRDFAAWTVDAINAVLDRRPVAGTRPSGAFRRAGAFRHDRTSVWASGMDDTGSAFQVALCDDLKSALELEHRLNALLH